jgi:hypothetical protein
VSVSQSEVLVQLEDGRLTSLLADPNLYYHGGDVRNARWFSRFLALQIQADVLGKPMEPYRD